VKCPACGSELKERITGKGALFLICPRWPACKISGTPELLERFEKPPPVRGPVPLGSFITQVAQMRIHQSKLRKAKTAEERNAIRKQALEALK
jgi:ssDNA-binding Zn-finger/Zn-ribbon topoisomerase 1